MITIHTVKQKNTGEDKNKHEEKNNISLISFFTIFNNIKGKKNKKGKKYWTYIRIRGRERHKKTEGSKIENIRIELRGYNWNVFL